MSFRLMRERLNLALYNSKEKVLKITRLISFGVSLVALFSLIYYYGFPQTTQSKVWAFNILQGSFLVYIVQYSIRLIYDFHPWQFLKKNRFEGMMVVLLTVEGISYHLTGVLRLQSLFVKIGLENFSGFSSLFIQFYFIVMIAVSAVRKGTGIPNFRLHPASMFILSFLLLIFIGTGLLMLPQMTHNGIRFIDAIFTSTSATCVTGLMVENTSEFTFRGQVVILMLIKLGGLNIIAFGSFLALAGRIGLGVRHHEVIEDFVHKDSFISAKGMLGRIIIWSVVIELAGALFIYFSWLGEVPFRNTGDKVFSSVFHAVSAFNSAGISTFDNGLTEPFLQQHYTLHIIVGVLVFLGALGFNPIFDIFGMSRIKERLRHRWKQITFGSKIALYFSFIFVAVGMVCFVVLERNHVLKEEGFGGAFISSFFQSVNRTSGFSTVDYHELGPPILLIMIFLMFLGASSGSTGGGIKTSTFAILWASTWSTIRGRKHVELFKHCISNELIRRAFSVLIFFIFGNVICIVLLSVTESHILAQTDRSVLDLIFEEVSALGTVGWSTGITPGLSEWGKGIIIVSMFVGRVGTLTVAFAFGKAAFCRNYRYPDGHTMVG